ncbi:MAG: tetratricopeptide repeat protein [Burkholderiales bacterium]|nr:tetratricopeptide repeat protein [Burkholderiales bacterium]
MARIERGELEPARAEFERALDLCHDFAPAHHALGSVQLQLGLLEDAADSLELAVLYDPQCAGAHADLAWARARLGSREAALDAIEQASGSRGASARVWTSCAYAYKALGQLVDSAGCFDRAVAAEPQSAELNAQLGYACFLIGDYAQARAAFTRALELDAGNLSALHNGGLLDLETGFPEQALDKFNRAYEAKAGAESLACVGHALRDLARLDEACAVYERVLEAYPHFGDARINASYAHLMRGDLAAGWERYESRFEATATPRRDVGIAFWRGEPLRGRRVLVHAEQGLGDEIMFASCLRDLIAQAQGCVLACSPRLAKLFARSFPGACVEGVAKDADSGSLRRLPACDFQVAIGSLPRYFRASAAAFDGAPYLHADPVQVSQWQSKLAGTQHLTIGISWRGGALRTRQWLRSVPLEAWRSLLSVPHCRFVALQNGDHRAELDAVCGPLSTDIVDLSAHCVDLDVLAAIVAALDLVISVDNTLVHLAGALGTETWVLLPSAPEWRYPRRGARMPWYASVRLFHAPAEGGAGPALLSVLATLQARLACAGPRQA